MRARRGGWGEKERNCAICNYTDKPGLCYTKQVYEVICTVVLMVCQMQK